MKLNNLQSAFVVHYAAGENGTNAALMAGYKEKTAAQTASRLLRNPKIVDAIHVERKARLDRLAVSKDYVLLRLVEIDQLDALDILNSNGDLLPVKDWPRVWRQSISALDIQSVMQGEIEVKKIKWPDKAKNLEMIGRFTDIQAFKDVSEVKTTHDGEINVNTMSRDEKEQRIAELLNKAAK